ncbi:YncE family protein [Marinobacter sp.]|uniref:YncE family protein n=1 Tax=Marinobacter sp. TaxID=50741 RepID=UPI003A9060DC
MNTNKLAPLAAMPLKASVLLASTLLLTACGGSNNSSDDAHTDTDIDTAGRLALFDTGASALKIVDLDSGDVLSSMVMTGEAPALHASPGNRYVVATQRGDDLVSFIDSGLYTEDHGDHMHDYAETPSLLSLTLNDHKPTHYTVGDSYGVVFFDGGDAASSKVTVFSDETLGSNSTLASLPLETNMHGVAKMVDGHLFVTYRDSSIPGTTLPTMVERYHLDGGSFEFEERYTETCPALHGAAVGAHSLGFGCGDGVLVVDLHEAGYPTTKLANPASLAEGARIGTLLGNHDVDELVGLAGDQMFVIDPESESQVFLELDIGAGVGPLVQGFTTHGGVFYVLGDDGGLRLFAPSNDWALLGTVQVMDAPGAGNKPAVTLSAAQNRLFVLAPDGQAVIEIDTTDGEIDRTIDLGFSASGIAWLGLADDGHDHHNEEHSH